MKQCNKLAVFALTANVSAEEVVADEIYLQFMDETLFDDLNMGGE